MECPGCKHLLHTVDLFSRQELFDLVPKFYQNDDHASRSFHKRIEGTTRVDGERIGCSCAKNYRLAYGITVFYAPTGTPFQYIAVDCHVEELSILAD